jgi:hypothetical protein
MTYLGWPVDGVSFCSERSTVAVADPSSCSVIVPRTSSTLVEVDLRAGRAVHHRSREVPLAAGWLQPARRCVSLGSRSA